MKNKSEIFRLAWELSRKASKKFGGKAKSYFSESLRMIYQKGYAKVKSLLNPSPKTILTSMVMVLIIILPVEIVMRFHKNDSSKRFNAICFNSLSC